MTKDLFSDHADIYAQFRPGYPEELFSYILSFVRERTCAWDCATGNGQSAQQLATFFERVEATDISEGQLSNAVKKPNIHYRISPEEQTPFPENTFDLITVATAYHWLDTAAFYKEANRVGKNGCVVAAWSYHLFYTADEQINSIIRRFYYETIHSYWDPERKYVDEYYKTIAFDFDPLPSKDFDNVLAWNRDQFLGYLQTWSAVQHYIRKEGHSPVGLIENDIKENWNEGEQKEIHFPLFLRIGRVKK